MIPTRRRGATTRPFDVEWNILYARFPDRADRPLPTEEEIDAFKPVDWGLHDVIRGHLEPHLGSSSSTFHDTEAPFPIDVALAEPEDGRAYGAFITVGASALSRRQSDLWRWERRATCQPIESQSRTIFFSIASQSRTSLPGSG